MEQSFSTKSVSEQVAKDLTSKPKTASTIKQACHFHVVEKALGTVLTSVIAIITWGEVSQEEEQVTLRVHV